MQTYQALLELSLKTDDWYSNPATQELMNAFKSSLIKLIKNAEQFGDLLELSNSLYGEAKIIHRQYIKQVICQFKANECLKSLHHLIQKQIVFLLGVSSNVLSPLKTKLINISIMRDLTVLIQEQLAIIESTMADLILEECKQIRELMNFDCKAGQMLRNLCQFIAHFQTEEFDITYDLQLHTFTFKFEIAQSQKISNKCLAYYKRLISDKLLSQTDDFYHQKALELQKSSSVIVYVERVLQICRFEKDMLQHLFPRSQLRIMRSIVDLMIFQRREYILLDYEDGLAQQLKDHRTQNLLDTYKLFEFTRILQGVNNPYQLFSKEIIQNIIIQGQAISVDQNIKDVRKSAEQSVLALLELKKENHKLIEGVFENDPECLKGFIKGMETLINIENDKTAHQIALITDFKLKEQLQGNPLDQLCLVEFLQNKDIFIKHYQQFLARRIIKGGLKDPQTELEACDILHRMNTSCNQLQTMIQDAIISGNLLKIDEKYSFQFVVGTYGSWPLGDETLFKAPPSCASLEFAYRQVMDRYKEKFPDREILYTYQYSQAEVRFQTTSDTYFLIMSGQQYVLFSTFNNSDSVSMEQLQAALDGSTTDEIQQQLHPFVAEGILAVHTGGYVLNLNYSGKRKKFMIPSAKVQEKQKVEVQVITEENKYIVDCFIIKKMKKLKHCSHVKLIDEIQQLMEQYRFDQAFFKRRLEQLIEQGYIERAKEDKQEDVTYNSFSYHYVA